MLTDAQLQTLAAALRAETDQTVVAAMAIRNDVALRDWCNGASAVNAWNEAMGSRALFEATDVTKFDAVNPGKRDAWRLLLEFAPIDFTRQKMRKAVPDVWGTTDAVAVLHPLTGPLERRVPMEDEGVASAHHGTRYQHGEAPEHPVGAAAGLGPHLGDVVLRGGLVTHRATHATRMVSPSAMVIPGVVITHHQKAARRAPRWS